MKPVTEAEAYEKRLKRKRSNRDSMRRTRAKAKAIEVKARAEADKADKIAKEKHYNENREELKCVPNNIAHAIKVGKELVVSDKGEVSALHATPPKEISTVSPKQQPVKHAPYKIEPTEILDLASVLNNNGKIDNKHQQKKFQGVKGVKLKARMLKLIRAGALITDIVKITGSTEDTIRALKKQYDLSFQRTLAWRESKVDLLEDLQRRLITGVSEADIQAATMNQKVGSFQVLLTAQRLLEEKSTDNIAHLHASVHDIKQAEAGRAKLIGDK